MNGFPLIRHKRVLIAVRLVFLAMIASMAIPGYRSGTLSPVLPVILGAYLVTHLAMLPEKGQAFFTQRVQAVLLLFDIFVLVVSLACLERYRQELFLALFLVVLLASASQKLSVSTGEFDAIEVIGSPFAEVLEGAALPDGAGRLHIPRLRGDYEVTRGPYLGTADQPPGTVWVLRKLAEPRIRAPLPGVD